MELYETTRYLLAEIGFPTGGSGSYIVHKRQITVIYVGRNNKDQRKKEKINK